MLAVEVHAAERLARHEPPHAPWISLQPFRNGLAGVLEMERNPACVPYRVSRDIGKLKAKQTFVRHGTVTEPPPAEEDALAAEAQRAHAVKSGIGNVVTAEGEARHSP
jgi:hypothetical protein